MTSGDEILRDEIIEWALSHYPIEAARHLDMDSEGIQRMYSDAVIRRVDSITAVEDGATGTTFDEDES
jgi:hypothetical protein|tara:strand:+ start:591 stop:794 length:204 start_codon:yes stop_codon:yes gene_type:complete